MTSRTTRPRPRARTAARTTRVAAALLAGTLALSACGGGARGGGAESGDGGRLSIATGNTTGVYYQLGGGLADVITKDLQGYQATAEATGASVENIQRVSQGDSDIGFTLADTAADAVKGQGAFEGKQPVRALMRIYTNYTHVVVRKDAGIDSVEDLKGKRVSTGSPNSGTEVIAFRLLEAAGLDPESDVKTQSLELGDTVAGMKDGTVDALVWSGGLPTGGITDLMTSIGGDVEFLDVSDQLPALQKEYGQVYQPDSIPADTYGTGQDVKTVGVPNLLVVHEDMDPGLARKITDLVFAEKQKLTSVHPEAENITQDTAPKTDPVPLHPGADKVLAGG